MFNLNRFLPAFVVGALALAPETPSPVEDPGQAPAHVSRAVDRRWRPYLGTASWFGFEASRKPHLGERQRVNLFRSRGGGKAGRKARR